MGRPRKRWSDQLLVYLRPEQTILGLILEDDDVMVTIFYNTLIYYISSVFIFSTFIPFFIIKNVYYVIYYTIYYMRATFVYMYVCAYVK